MKKHATVLVAIVAAVIVLGITCGHAFAQAVIDAGIAPDAGVVAPPVVVPSPDSDLGEFAKAVYAAFTSGSYKVFAGLVLVGLTWGTRKYLLGRVAWFKTKLGGFAIAFALSLSLTFGTALASGMDVTLLLAVNALTTAAVAAGIWQWVQSWLKGQEQGEAGK
jgi:hypothetical protein